MAKVKKTVLPVGKHVSPDGVVDVTADRVNRWVEKFNRLKAAGVEFPVSWGHAFEATPDNASFLASRFNAGYVDQIFANAEGGLDAIFDCPGLEVEPDGRLVGVAKLPEDQGGGYVKTAIKEVSAGIWNSWTDGKGQKHDDIIAHIALTPLPVVAGQSGFAAALGTLGSYKLDNNSFNAPAGVSLLSTLTLSTGSPPPFAKKDKNTDAEDTASKLADVKPKPGADKDGDEDPEAESLLTPTLNSGSENGDTDEQRVQRIVAMLAEGGAPLPPDTTGENVLERIEVALGVVLHRMRQQQQQQQQQQPAPGTINSSDTKDITEGSGPVSSVMLATVARLKKQLSDGPDGDPVVRSLMRNELSNRKELRKIRVDKLVERGLRPEVAEELLGSKIRLSTLVSLNGIAAKDETDRRIDLLEKVLPEKQFASIFLSTLVDRKHAVEHSTPADAATGSTETVRLGNIDVPKETAEHILESVNRVSGG